MFPAPLTILMLRKKDMKPAVKYGVIAAAWIVYLFIGIFGKSSKNETTGNVNSAVVESIEAETSEQEMMEEKPSDEITTEVTIEIVAGEKGEYGQKLVLNENTEFSDELIGYFVPAGTYEVTNLGDNMSQANVYKNEKVKTSEGWEEWSDGKAEVIDVNKTVKITIPEGYFFSCDEPSHFKLKLVQNGGNTSDISADENSDTLEIYYEKDKVVNAFIADFNSSEDVKITDIRQGNIRQKAYAKIGSVSIEMLDSYSASADNYNMSIFGGNTDEKTEAMFEVFSKVAKKLDKNLSDQQIEDAILQWKEKDVLLEDVSLGELTITYVPSKELSYGRNDSRIDVSSSTYARPD